MFFLEYSKTIRLTLHQSTQNTKHKCGCEGLFVVIVVVVVVVVAAAAAAAVVSIRRKKFIESRLV